MEAELALIVTVGGGLDAALTVTVTAEVTFPLDPVAVAV